MRKLYIIILLFMTMLLCLSCRTKKVIVTKEVPVETPVIHHDTVYLKQKQKIFVMQKDSIIRSKDTLMYYRTQVIDLSTHDTVYFSKVDTVHKPVYIKQEVVTPTKGSKYKSPKSKARTFLIVLSILAIGIVIIVAERIMKSHLPK